MTGRRQFYQALTLAPAHEREQQAAAACPGPGWLDGYPASASPAAVRHVTFCPCCQQQLRAARGLPLEQAPAPDLSAVQRRLNRAVRWDGLKDRLSSLLAVDLASLQPQPGFVRSGAAEPGGQTGPALIVLNLSAFLSLSATAVQCQIEPASAGAAVALCAVTGFLPELAGHDALALVLPRVMIEDFLDSGDEPSPADAAGLERRLQLELEAGRWETPDNPLLLGAVLAFDCRLERRDSNADARFACPVNLLPLLLTSGHVLAVVVS